MTKEEIIILSKEIGEITNNFKPDSLNENIKTLKDGFDVSLIDELKKYRNTIENLQSLLREAHMLFIYLALNIVCIEEEKLYYFDVPFQAGMQYNAVMKEKGHFYLLDEDGDYGNVFANEKFSEFIDELYWELYDS